MGTSRVDLQGLSIKICLLLLKQSLAGPPHIKREVRGQGEGKWGVLCQGTYGDPRGMGGSYERGTPVPAPLHKAHAPSASSPS